MKPQPKKIAIRLKSKAYTVFRREVFEHYRGICCFCMGPAPLTDVNGNYNPFVCGDVCHIKSVGAGGSDTLENCQWGHHSCHMKQHNGGFKL